MKLLLRLIRKRIIIFVATVCAGAGFAAITLFWNMQLSDIINTISAGHSIRIKTLVLSLAAMGLLCAVGWLKTYLSGYTCELLTHDLRMGYQRLYYG